MIENEIYKEMKLRVFNGIVKELGHTELIEPERNISDIINSCTKAYISQINETLTVK